MGGNPVEFAPHAAERAGGHADGDQAVLVGSHAAGPLAGAAPRSPRTQVAVDPTSARSFLPMCQQELPENDGIVVRLVPRRIDKCDRPFKRQVEQSIKLLATLIDLRGISPAELLPTGWIVTEPFPQLCARCELLHLPVDCRLGFGQPPRPQSINQDTFAVTVGLAFICALQSDIILGDFSTHLHRSPGSPTVRNIGRCDHVCDDKISSGSRPQGRSPSLHATMSGEKR